MGDIALRDYFAAQAVAGILGAQPARFKDLGVTAEVATETARLAHAIADALIAERTKATPPPTTGAYSRARKAAGKR
jgi:hypothetical protein